MWALWEPYWNYLRSFAGNPSSKDPYETFKSWWRDNYSTYYVAREGSEIAAFCHVRVNDMKELRTRITTIENIFVGDKWRNGGIATELLFGALRSEAPMGGLHLDVLEENHLARGWWEMRIPEICAEFGWRRMGKRGHNDDVNVDYNSVLLLPKGMVVPGYVEA